MPPGWRVERLAPAHDRRSFTCGKPALDNFLRQYAGQYDQRNIGRTFVAVIPGEVQVRGYYTLSSGGVAFDSVPEAVSRKLPRHPVPVITLGRLAVDQTVRGQGLGSYLLVDALRRCLALSEQVGVFAVEVHALDDEARSFYLKYEFQPLKDDFLHLYLPMKVVQKLFG